MQNCAPEAQRELMSGGSGKLVIGFHLDPIYHVHWNNLAAPLKYSITAPEGVKISPAEGEAPKIKEESDVDPREFVLEIKGADPKKPLVLKVDYFACNESEGWCKPVSQEYEIKLERDPDAGRVMGGGRGSGRRPGGGRAPGGGAPNAASIIERIFEADTNGDGKISKEEAPERMADRFDQMDTNDDGFVDREEIEARFRRRSPRRR